MTPSESVALGRALEEMERPKAKEAQLSGLKVGDESRSVAPNETGKRFDTREVVAPAKRNCAPLCTNCSSHSLRFH